MLSELVEQAKVLARDAGITPGESGAYFPGINIWLAASSREAEVINLAANCRDVLRQLGATVNGSKEFGPGTLKAIDESDLIIMFAATPGVSARALEICFISEQEKNNNRDKIHVYMPRPFAGGHIYRRLEHYRARYINPCDESAFAGASSDLISKCVYDVCDTTLNRKRQEMLRNKEFIPTIGIVTALPVELRAVIDSLIDIRPDPQRTKDSLYQEYIHGVIPCLHGGKHKVVVARAGKGNNKAAVLATALMSQYRSVQDIFMVGVAAGVPYVEDPQRHVRLGDIVVCDETGVIQYDMVKLSTSGTEYTPPPRPPGHAWITRFENYMAMMPEEPKYWAYLDEILTKQQIKRPRKGPLKDCPWVEGVKAVRQPPVPGNDPMRPRIHQGPIGSANTVLKTAESRDALRKQFKIRAVEMESSGIAEAAWQHEKGYFIVRGICDFANDDKNKIWPPYAAAAAAAFARELIETMPLTSVAQ